MKKPKTIGWELINKKFKPCPFCGEKVNVFQEPETRYGESCPFGWRVECMNMGCIINSTTPDQSIEHLLKQWNKRYDTNR